jgi:hypothetical protein
MPDLDPWSVAAFAAFGVAGGLAVLARGLAAYRRGQRLADIASSRIASLAAGEVRISGRVVAAGVTLVSPLQSQPCVYYNASVTERDGDSERTVLRRERSVGFFLDDETARIRVFPRGARWGVPPRVDERSDAGMTPPSIMLNRDADSMPSELDRDAAIAALLTVRPAAGGDMDGGDGRGLGGSFGSGLAERIGGRDERRYREARIEPGEIVTVVGSAVPFAHLDDPDAADVWEDVLAADDPEVTASIAEARAAGLLRTPEAAWGNAAIPGFGIGRPATAPVLDPGAATPTLGDAAALARARETFHVASDELVVAAMDESPLAIYAGAPTVALASEREAYLLGLAGAFVAIVSAIALALAVSGRLPA